MTPGGRGRRAAQCAIVLAAAALAVGCTSSDEPDSEASASTAVRASVLAVQCSTSVNQALVLTWGVTAGRTTGSEAQGPVTEFLIASQGQPEEGIYTTYRAKGLADMARGQAEKGNEPASLLVRYSPAVQQECADAYPR